MNTNSNLYTVIYTTLIVILVAAILAYASLSLKPRQEANEKADIISQMLTAAEFGEKAEFTEKGNAYVLDQYSQNIQKAILINTKGEVVDSLKIADRSIYTVSQLKAQNNLIKAGKSDQAKFPVYIFKNGITVVPVYGAGLWGPIWGYLAFEPDMKTMVRAYFDHESETPGLGAKIKDDPTFQAEFSNEQVDFSDAKVFNIIKGGAPKDADGKSVIDNKIDAITGATMTSKGLDAAINTWLGCYKAYFLAGESAAQTATQPSDTTAACDSTMVAPVDSLAK
jgi:Na+-transporting NADH:ubiquinone oxidoreductase subunit C